MTVKYDSNNNEYSVENGVLTISKGESGTGVMPDFTSSSTVRTLVGEDFTSVIIGEGITRIGNYSFYKNGLLNSVLIGQNVSYIATNSFMGCTSLTSLTIGGSVTYIGQNAFYGCTSLPSVTIPDSVTQLSQSAFKMCSSLTDINVGSNNLNYSSDNGVLFNKAKTTLVLYPGGKAESSYTVPNGVTSIGVSSFSYNTNIASVTLPNTITSIGSNAFDQCTNLSHIPLQDGITSIGSYAFNKCTSLTTVTIPNGVTSVGSSLFNECTALVVLVLPEGITSIPDQFCRGCTSLKYTNIPDSVTSISTNAYNSTAITDIDIPVGVTSIGAFAFSDCNSLKSINIPNTVTTIGMFAFQSCDNMTSAIIGNGITSIGNNAFFYYIKDITFLGETPATLGTNVFLLSQRSAIHVPTGCEDTYKSAWTQYASYIHELALKHVSYNGHELQVYSAIKDGDGNIIDETYAKQSDIPSLSKTDSGSGNAVTGIDVNGHAITVTKGATFLTQHQTLPKYNGSVMTSATDIPLVKTDYWDAKASTAVATIDSNGLMAKEDKQKVHDHANKATLDSIGGTATATTLGVDTVVTSGSSNLITSGAVYNVLGDIEAALRAIRGV